MGSRGFFRGAGSPHSAIGGLGRGDVEDSPLWDDFLSISESRECFFSGFSCEEEVSFINLWTIIYESSI